MPIIAPAADWDTLVQKMKTETPEAFGNDGRILNLMEGRWQELGFGRHYESAVDGRSLGKIPMLDLDTALLAVKFATSESLPWAAAPLDVRRRRVTECWPLHRARREKSCMANFRTTRCCRKRLR
jgi:hypothetical protein